MTRTLTRCPGWCRSRKFGHDEHNVRHYGDTHTLHASEDGELAVEVSQPLAGGSAVLIVTVVQNGQRRWHDIPLPHGAWLVDRLARWWDRPR